MPRTETQTLTLYQFDELDERAKERARDWWRQFIASDTDWSEHVLSDAADIADVLGINLRQREIKLYGGGTRREPQIYWSLDNGGGVGFDASYAYVAGSARAIREHAPQDAELHRIADTLQRAQKEHFYRLVADCNASGDGTAMRVSVEDNGDAPVDRATDSAVEWAIRDFAHWIHSALQREYEWRMSDEQVDDDIRANEYEFTEEGERA